MSELANLLEFYMKDGWQRTDDGQVVPSQALLNDQGRRAEQYSAPSRINPPPPHAAMAVYTLAAAEVAEALRDLLLAMNMPPSEHRTMKLGQAAVTLQKAEYRIRCATHT